MVGRKDASYFRSRAGSPCVCLGWNTDPLTGTVRTTKIKETREEAEGGGKSSFTFQSRVLSR